MKQLIGLLEKGRQSVYVLGGKVVATPFGGRVLGLFPKAGKNLFWISEKLMSDPSAFFAQEGWMNIGGDRTWIGSELEVNGDPNLSTYEVLRTIDPATYHVVSSSVSEVVMECAMVPHFKTPDTDVPLKLTKTVRLLGDPPAQLPPNVACAGYELIASLSLEQALHADIRPGIWNILQVPCGGEIRVPVKRETAPCRFIGTPVFQSLEEEITTRADTDAGFKFGIHVDDSRGIMFYMDTENPSDSTLLMRTFSISPASCYSDVPAGNPDAIGCIHQFYVDDGTYGGFGELEYHAPYLCAERPVITDTSQVWGFTGPADELVKLMNELSK